MGARVQPHRPAKIIAIATIFEKSLKKQKFGQQARPLQRRPRWTTPTFGDPTLERSGITRTGKKYAIDSRQSNIQNLRNQAEPEPSNDNRVLPRRNCKNLGVSDWVPQKRKPRGPRYLNRTPRKRQRRKRSARETARLQTKLKQAVINAAQARRPPVLQISRTVEMINQTTEGWREEKSKLLFMVGLGLTPIPSKPGIIVPCVKLTSLSSEEIEEIERRRERVRAENAAKIARRKERVCRFEKIRAWRMKLFSDPEMIDLTFEHSSNSNSLKRDEGTTKLPVEEPLQGLRTIFDNLAIQNQDPTESKSQADNFMDTNTCETNFAEPIEIMKSVSSYVMLGVCLEN